MLSCQRLGDGLAKELTTRLMSQVTTIIRRKRLLRKTQAEPIHSYPTVRLIEFPKIQIGVFSLPCGSCVTTYPPRVPPSRAKVLFNPGPSFGVCGFTVSCRIIPYHNITILAARISPETTGTTTIPCKIHPLRQPQ